MNRKYAWLLLPIGGVLTGFCLLFPKIGFLEWFTMVPALLFLFSRAAAGEGSYRRWYLWGFLYFYPFYITVFHWFCNLYPMEFMGVNRTEAVLLVIVCWFGLSLLQTIFSALIFPLFAFLSRRRPWHGRGILLPMLFAAQYVIAEWSQTLTWAGVPWARLAIGQVEYGALVGSAALFGSYFITLAIVLVNGYLAWGILCRRFWNRCRTAALVTAAVFLLQLGAGLTGYLLSRPEEGKPVTVAALQGNVGSNREWTRESWEKTKTIYTQYTAEAAKAGATVLLFPETFVPGDLYDSNELGRFVSYLARTNQVTIFCGAFYTDDAGEQYNAVFMVHPDGRIDETVYAKRHLVPFGEYVPWRGFFEKALPLIIEMCMVDEDLAFGEGSALFTYEGDKVGALICFDSIYEGLTLESVRDGAELLVLPTNDSWFTDSRGIYMHHAQARLRAVESGRWIVRCADTGVSSVIAPDGDSFEDQPPLVEGIALHQATIRDNRTLYSRIGNLLILLLLPILFAAPATELCLYLRSQLKKQ